MYLKVHEWIHLCYHSTAVACETELREYVQNMFFVIYYWKNH